MGNFSVSELGKNGQSIGIVNYLNYQLQDLQRQASTGKKADTFGGLGGASTQLTLSLRGQLNSIDTYKNVISNVKLRTDTMDTVLSSLPTDAADILAKMKAIPQGGGTTPNLTILKDAANSALSSLLERLNTRVDGKYIFSGNQTGTVPITDTAAALTNVATTVAAYQTGTPASTVITNLAALTDTNLGLNTTIAAAGNVTTRIDDNLTVDYTVKASEQPFKDLITSLATIVKMDYDPAHADAFWSLYNNAMSSIDTASGNINTRNGQLGVVRKQMDDMLTIHGDTSGAVEANLSNVEDVDGPTVATKLTNLQTQIQSAYAIISQISKLSIIDYIS